MFPPDQPGSKGCPPKICADEVGDEAEGQVEGGWDQCTDLLVYVGRD